MLIQHNYSPSLCTPELEILKITQLNSTSIITVVSFFGPCE